MSSSRMERRSQIRSRHHPGALGNRSGGRCGALGRLEGAHADYFEHLDTMILLTHRVPAKEHSLALLDCVYHLAKASEKRLDSCLIERDSARLRCREMSTSSLVRAIGQKRLPRRGEPFRERKLRNCCVVSRKGPACYRWATKSSKVATRMRGILTRQQSIIRCRLLEARGFWTLAARQGARTSPPSLAPPRA